MVFIDINGVIGSPLFDSISGKYSGYKKSGDLINDMDFYGIDYSVVYHNNVKNSDPYEANLRLIEDISDSERLLPCWCVLPSNTEDRWKTENIIKDIEKYDIKVLRMFPAIHNINLGLPSMEEFFKSIEEKNLLLIIHYKNLGVAVPEPVDYDMVVLDRICEKYPGLNIVSSGPLRQLYYLLEKHSNLYYSLEWEMHSNIIKDMIERFGAGRILFGTPNCEISGSLSGAVVSMLNYSGISDNDKKKIAGLNLLSLLNKGAQSVGKDKKLFTIPDKSGNENMDSRLKSSVDAFINRTGSGLAFKTPIIDIHFHVGEFVSEYKPGSGVAYVQELLKKEDLESLCINSTEAVTNGDHVAGNKLIYELCEKYPDRLLGFYVFNPNFKESIEEMDRYLSTDFFKGIKIHPRFHKCDISDKAYIPVWEAARKFNAVVLSHTGEGQAHSDPEQYYEISKKYSDVTFILGHGGESFKGIMQCIEIVNSRKNVYIDISGWGFMHKGILEFVTGKVGADKVLFGSDVGWIDFNYAVGVVAYSMLSESEKEQILYKNARKVLRK